jgi:hypothetical protein
MLRFVLDEHISPRVAEGLRRRNKNLCAISFTQWEEGKFLGRDDWICLREAGIQNLTLVTYDRRTIPPILKAWAEQGRSHGGVIFVDEKTISPADIGGLVQALFELWKQRHEWDWVDRICFLHR